MASIFFLFFKLIRMNENPNKAINFIFFETYFNVWFKDFIIFHKNDKNPCKFILLIFIWSKMPCYSFFSTPQNNHDKFCWICHADKPTWNCTACKKSFHHDCIPTNDKPTETDGDDGICLICTELEESKKHETYLFC